MISAALSEQVLLMGPEHRNHKGGVGAVIDSYTAIFPGMKFIPSYNGAYAGWKNHLLFIRALLALCARLMSDRKIGIVHLHGASRGSFYRKYLLFLTAKKLFRKKVVYHIHGGGFYDFYQGAGPGVQRRIRYFLNHADCVICLSGSWEKLYSTHFRPGRLAVIPNFVEQPGALPHKEKGKVIFLFLGLITTAKGVYEWIDAIEALVHEGKDRFECWIGGNGEVARLTALVEAKGLQSCVKVLGWVAGDQKQEVLRKAHVYVLPSHKEGMPVSILEAMAYGMPVISTRVGGIPELVEEGVTGLLIDAGNRQELQRHMASFLDNPALIGSMGEAGRKRITAQFSKAGVVQQLSGIYEALLTETTGA